MACAKRLFSDESDESDEESDQIVKDCHVLVEKECQIQEVKQEAIEVDFC